MVTFGATPCRLVQPVKFEIEVQPANFQVKAWCDYGWNWQGAQACPALRVPSSLHGHLLCIWRPGQLDKVRPCRLPSCSMLLVVHSTFAIACLYKSKQARLLLARQLGR